MEAVVDIVTVYHNEKNHRQSLELRYRLEELEGDKVSFHMWDNKERNLGFSAGCNAASKLGEAPIIGFINPDVELHDTFVDRILPAFQPIEEGDDPVIVGVTFGKHPTEWESWGCKVWVCGAFMFVKRDWFQGVGGFDERFVWSWEETDLIRTAEFNYKRVVAIDRFSGWDNVVSHTSPDNDNKIDSEYKRYHFNNGARLYREKWLM